MKHLWRNCHTLKLAIKEDQSLHVIYTNQIREMIMWSGVYDIPRKTHPPVEKDKSCSGCVQSTKFEQEASTSQTRPRCYYQWQPQQGKLGVRRKGWHQICWLVVHDFVHNHPNKMLLIYTPWHTQTRHAFHEQDHLTRHVLSQARPLNKTCFSKQDYVAM